MIQKISAQQGVTFYIGKRGKCVDIDIDDNVTTLTFARMRDASIKNRAYPPSYFLRNVKKQFPNVREIVIEQGVTDIDISNMMFPNVRKVYSYSYLFASGGMLMTTSYNQNKLKNTFCRNPDETVDLLGVTTIDGFAFEGCKSTDIVNDREVGCICDNAFAGSVFSEKRVYKDGMCIVGTVLFDVEPGVTGITLPYGLKSIYSGTDSNIKDIKCIKTESVERLNAFINSNILLDNVEIDTDG